MADNKVMTTLNIVGLKKIGSGKVREIFELDSTTLLFVATDRISAYDVGMENGIPQKGALLTQLSTFWFDMIARRFPTLQTHLLRTDDHPESSVADEATAMLLKDRTMRVRRVPVVALESIVRGYITGSAWSEYKTKGTVHGMPMPPGLQESERLERAIWTPSTKAEAVSALLEPLVRLLRRSAGKGSRIGESDGAADGVHDGTQGQHDENISRERAVELVGGDVAARIETVSLQIYEMARDYAATKGIIIADTKFEFGLDPATGDVVLIDEVLTPDSSRFWPSEGYTVGKGQSSYDKQYLRDWLTRSGLKGKEGVEMTDEVVRQTAAKYREAFEKLTGRQWV